MSAGLSFRCPGCANTTRIEIAEIDRLRAEVASLKAKLAATKVLLDKARNNPFGSLFGGLR